MKVQNDVSYRASVPLCLEWSEDTDLAFAEQIEKEGRVRVGVVFIREQVA